MLLPKRCQRNMFWIKKLQEKPSAFSIDCISKQWYWIIWKNIAFFKKRQFLYLHQPRVVTTFASILHFILEKKVDLWTIATSAAILQLKNSSTVRLGWFKECHCIWENSWTTNGGFLIWIESTSWTGNGRQDSWTNSMTRFETHFANNSAVLLEEFIFKKRKWIFMNLLMSQFRKHFEFVDVHNLVCCNHQVNYKQKEQTPLGFKINVLKS